MCVEYEHLQTARVCVVQRRSGARNLLSHVYLHEAQQLGREIEEVCHNRIHGDEIEAEFGVRVGAIVRGCDGGRALTGTDIVEVSQTTELVVDLTHDADLVSRLLRGRSPHVHVLLRDNGKEERNVRHLASY